MTTKTWRSQLNKAIRNNAAVNVHRMSLCRHVSFLLNRFLDVELLSGKIDICLIFKETANLSPIPLYITVNEGSGSIWSVVISHCCLNLHFPNS